MIASDGTLYGLTRAQDISVPGGNSCAAFRLGPQGMIPLKTFTVPCDDSLFYVPDLFEATDGNVYGHVGADVFQLSATGAYTAPISSPPTMEAGRRT